MRPVQLLIGLCAVIPPLAVQAQADAGSLLNQQQRQERRIPDRLPEAQGDAARPTLKSEAGKKVLVKRIRFSGAVQLATPAELQAVVADAIGKELDFAALEQLAARVSSFLKSKGYLLARAYLPRQDLTDGELEIALLEGRLDGSSGAGKAFTISAEGQTHLRIQPERLAAIAASYLAPGATVREGDLERATLLMNDLPGISARASLEPGLDADSTRVAITAQEGPLFGASASADDYGNRDTGPDQLSLAAQFNDPFRIGDQANLSLTHTSGLDLARLSYGVPLGSQGLKLTAALSDMSYKIIRGTGQEAGLKGSSTSTSLTLAYPVIRSRITNLNTSLGYSSKALKDDSQAGNLRDKRLDNWSLGVSGDRLDNLAGGGVTSGNLSWTGGTLDLSRNADDAASDAATYQAQGSFNKFSYGLSRLQKLPSNFTLSAALSGQVSSDNLDSSEKFILGGPYGVRAYSGSEGIGDAGWLVNLELRYDLPGSTTWGNLQFISFVDAGGIQLHTDTKGIPNATATAQNSYDLSGWGVGINLSKAASHSVRLGWAKRIGSNPGRSVSGLDADSQSNTSRVWLQANVWF
jgi:hemolysin activation/secretion protein